MSLHFTFKGTEPTEALKARIENRMDKLNKFVEYPMQVHVFLSVQKETHTVEVKCHAEHKEMSARHKSTDLYESIDIVAHKLEAQLKKEREKRKGHSKAHQANRKSSLKVDEALDADVPHLAKKILRTSAK